jgi:hypothetical protein
VPSQAALEAAVSAQPMFLSVALPPAASPGGLRAARSSAVAADAGESTTLASSSPSGAREPSAPRRAAGAPHAAAPASSPAPQAPSNQASARDVKSAPTVPAPSDASAAAPAADSAATAAPRPGPRAPSDGPDPSSADPRAPSAPRPLEPALHVAAAPGGSAEELADEKKPAASRAEHVAGLAGGVPARAAASPAVVASRPAAPSAQPTGETDGKRQAAVAAAVNLVTLKRSAHAEVDVPELGRVSISADSKHADRPGIDVSVVAHRPEAADVLRANEAELSRELQRSAVPLGKLTVGSEPTASGTSDGSPRERESGRGRSAEAPEEPAEQVSGPRGQRVRIVL